MIGLVVVTHRDLAAALLDAATSILGQRPELVCAVSIDLNESAEKLRRKIRDGIKTVNRNRGVLILTDMFGGTPSNLSYSFLEEGKVDVICGVNLPLLIKAVSTWENQPMTELVTLLEAFGKESISVASRILKGNKRN